ncbi:heat-shock protein Hsp20 [Sulfolobales archaeon HS-7]|nr:heat-shock protein Hsp20 [Sulfolobales archaeon HS-7]
MEMILREISKQLDELTREFYERVLPPIDMYEEGNELVIMVDLPGFNKDNIHVRIRSDNVLLIEAKKEDEKMPGIKYSSQRPRRISRAVRLPVKTPKDATVEGKYENGVLSLRIPIEGAVKVKIE